MTEIPEDVMRAAVDVVYSAEQAGVDMGNLPGAVYIAQAIAAERERCAGIADRRADALDKIKGYRSEVAELRTLAVTIRRGEQP